MITKPFFNIRNIRVLGIKNTIIEHSLRQSAAMKNTTHKNIQFTVLNKAFLSRYLLSSY